LPPRSVPTSVKALSFPAGKVVGTKRDKHTVWRYDRYAATYKSLQVEVICILESHGRYGETPCSDLMDKGIQVKGAFDLGHVCPLPTAAGVLL
jgi:hypothetical protein